ncbi:hypothetical protein ACIHEI_37195 [Kitasatospora sp. NPDC051984]|uniref:hypothetical protein n=1 Tax=Kitasatospora sp. NPDC051984 TaxID=3364059 RepID=UPI0037C9C024
MTTDRPRRPLHVRDEEEAVGDTTPPRRRPGRTIAELAALAAVPPVPPPAPRTTGRRPLTAQGRRMEAARRLLDMWIEDVGTAQEFPGARWNLAADGSLHCEAESDEDTEIWADYLGIDLTRTGRLEGHRDYTPDGPYGPVVPVTVSTITA